MSLLEQGSRLGQYLLLGPLGEGGMGKVYRARDVRLDREVAIKVLLPRFAEDPEWLARFEREARLLASFSHPGIATVHGLDDASGVRYLVMELVPGQSLADRLLSGPLPLADALEVGRQIAEALEAAHERGIIHRDLKPGNVMLTPDGKVKVLDFGLARLAAVTVESISNVETRVQEAVTVEGALVGTPAYVSPEQARGQKLDRRTDVWALGCVLFEALTGRKAFAGETLSDVLAAVISSEPPWQALPAAVPPRVTALLRRCLKKEVRRRLCDAGDARIELEEALHELAHPPAPIQAPRSRSGWLTAALVALAALAGGIGLGVAVKPSAPGKPPPDPPPPQAKVTEWTGEQLLDGAAVVFGPRVSPDEKWLAFGTLIDGQTQVGVLNLETGDRFVRTEDRSRGMLDTLSWSANSQRIYFDRFFDTPQGVYTATPPGVKQAGGNEALVVEKAECPQVTHDGSLLYCKPHEHGRSRFYLRSLRGEEKLVLEHPVELTAGWPPAAVRALRSRPEAVFCGKLHDGKSKSPERFLYLLDLTGKNPPRRLYDQPFEGDLVPLGLAPDEEFVYTVLPANDSYEVVRLPLSGKPPGKPPALWTTTNSIFGLDVDSAGRIYLCQFPQPREVLRFTIEGGQPQRLAYLARGREMEPIRLPCGRLLLPSRAFGRDRLLLGHADGELMPLLDDGSESRHPASLVGADRLAFISGPAKTPDLKLATLVGDRVGQVTTLRDVPADGLTGLSASPDGKELYYVRDKEVWWVPTAGGTPTSLGKGDGFAVHPSERRLLVQRNELEGWRLYWVSIDNGERTLVKVKGPLRLAPYLLGSQAIDDAGKTALVGVASPDLWFWQTAQLDLTTGELRRVPIRYESDVSPANWTRGGGGKGGEILAVGYPLRSELWRLTPR